MAETWARNRRGKRRLDDRYTKVDALAARRVLRDAYRARHELSEAFQSENVATRRLRWVTAITLLRAVGHALDSVDVKRSPVLKQAAKDAWTRWKNAPFHNLIFHEFIKLERDVLLKEYRFTERRVVVGEPESEPETIGATTILFIGDRTYSPLEAIDAALAWWESEIANIEDAAGA
jgi:hypothetical protein